MDYRTNASLVYQSGIPKRKLAMVHLVKHLTCKHEDLSSIARMIVRRKKIKENSPGSLEQAYNLRAGVARIGRVLALTDQCNQLGKFQASERPVSKNRGEPGR